MKRTVFNLVVNLCLLSGGMVMVCSGLLIQIAYHMGHHGTIDVNNNVLGINYSGWSYIHKLSVVFISVILTLHIIQHRKWYKNIIKKNLINKNRQVIILSIVFTLVAITGYIPWFIKLAEGSEITRKTFIEIHDKLALILIVYLILHVFKRLKWYKFAFKKLK